jgi:hypothetical protein
VRSGSRVIELRRALQAPSCYGGVYEGRLEAAKVVVKCGPAPSAYHSAKEMCLVLWPWEQVWFLLVPVMKYITELCGHLCMLQICPWFHTLVER